MTQSTTKNVQPLIQWLRHASPYVNALRNSVVVIHFPVEAIRNPSGRELIHDLALLSHLDLQIVLVFGARAAIDAALLSRGHQPHYIDDQRVTDDTSLSVVKETVGSLRLELEAQLSMGVADTPMSGATLRVSSGNFVTAQPIGVLSGVDFAHTGKVRQIDQQAIKSQLNHGHIVLLSPLGYSRTGDVFNLRSEEVATDAAIALQAEKLIFMTDTGLPCDEQGQLIRQFTLSQAEQQLSSASAESAVLLKQAIYAIRRGVPRAHLVSHKLDGALLTELYTRDGCGAMLFNDGYESLRRARANDVPGLLNLIEPLERSGVLVPREREQLELDIGHFYLIERDGMIIACAALFAHDEQSGELACMATHNDYRGLGCAARLLEHIQHQARRQNLRQLFVLTTQTAHWFLERGFERASLAELPANKRAQYNPRRASQIYLKTL